MSDPTTTTQAIAFTIPLLPGKTDADRNALESCWHGERSLAYRESRKRLGITREAVWIQPTPDGDTAVVYLEAHDVQRALRGIGESEDAFERWFRDHCLDVHGIDLKAGFPPLDQVLDLNG